MVASNFAIAHPTNLTPSFIYEQRLLAFARDTLQYNWKIRHYASNLHALAFVAIDSKETPEIRRRALAVCRERARELLKFEEKLMSNLVILLPDVHPKEHESNAPRAPIEAKTSAADIAAQLNSQAEDLFISVHRFIYEQNHTVTVPDLLNPPLIQSLKTIQAITTEFQTVLR